MRCLNCMKEFDEKYGVCPFCGFIPGSKAKEAYHLYPGTILKSRYIVGTVVGFGGFGITYRAWDQTLDRKMAIKEYYPNGLVNRVPGTATVIVFSGDRAGEFQKGKERFLDEARNMTKFLEHPNIVDAYEFFEKNNTAYIVMEFLEGLSYKEYLKNQGGTADTGTAISVTLSVLDALKEIHSKKIIHRDISPDNVFMVPRDDGSVLIKLIDFGAARFSDDEEEKTRSIILKPGYAPPEQYRSRSRQGAFTDIYSVGAMLYRALTGVMPEESINRVVEDKLKEPMELNEGIPKYLNDAIMRAMALNPDLRFKNADSFRDALLNKKKVLDVGSELKRKQRNRNLIIALAACLVILLGAACFGIYTFENSRLYSVSADLKVAMPDINGESQDILSQENTERVFELDSSDDMLLEMLSEFTERFVNVSVERSITDNGDYIDLIFGQAENDALPSAFESTGILPSDSLVWESMGSLDTAYETLDRADYYFMDRDSFKAVFEDESGRKQIPISFSAPVLYVNTHMITDETILSSLSSLDSVTELIDSEEEVSFCVSADMLDIYRDAFIATDDVENMEEFDGLDTSGSDHTGGGHSGDSQGYEPFLKEEKAYLLGSTDDYEMVRSALGGIYQMVVLSDLQQSGRVKGRFTHLWSVNGNLTEDEETAAQNLVYYLMQERCQDIFNVQSGNGLSMNKNMMDTYVENNDEFSLLADSLDSLQIIYNGETI